MSKSFFVFKNAIFFLLNARFIFTVENKNHEKPQKYLIFKGGHGQNRSIIFPRL